MKPRISVIMPAYKCAEYIAETIQSVQKQDFTDWELIVVDDGSPDNAAEIVTSLAAEDPRITLLQQPNGKQGKARNNGIRNAKGDLIAFLDADDLWPENKLSRSLEFLEKDNVDLVFTDGYICLFNDMSRRDHTFDTLNGKMEGQTALDLFYESNRIPTSSVLCRKEALTKVGLFDESTEIQNCEDYMLWVTMLKAGSSFYGIDENLLFYRVHSNGSTSQELNHLFPVIRTIYNFGKPDKIRKTHLILKYRRLVELLIERNELQKADKLIDEFSRRVTSFPYSLMVRLSRTFGTRIFNSVFWRVTGIELKKNSAKW